MSDRVRIGILGAARIVRQALVAPARHVPEIAVTAIAARDPDRAREHAAKHGIPRVHDSYDALVRDPDLDAVYVPLPIALHGVWSVRAMESGKHVLCEKPIAGNADEARLVAKVAERTGRVICEAMHPNYHGLFDELEAIRADGVLGEVRHVEAWSSFPIPRTKDIRWQYELGGGALMDVGVYAVSMLRALAGMEPVEVTEATARTRTPKVDSRVEARLRFPNGATGRILAAMWGRPILASRAELVGTQGKLTILNPIAPHLFHRISLRTPNNSRPEQIRVAKHPSTYTCQLRAFASAILNETNLRTDHKHFIPNMRVIDAIYQKTGLPLREGTLPAGESDSHGNEASGPTRSPAR